MCSSDLTCTLAGGDDYELVFTASPQHAERVVLAARSAQVAVTRIGRIVAGSDLHLLDRDGKQLPNTFGAFDHFKS